MAGSQATPGSLIGFCLHGKRPALFKGQHFEAEVIVLCIRWYRRYPLNLRQLEEMMAEWDLSWDHVSIWCWVQQYAPELNRRCRPELRSMSRSWRVERDVLPSGRQRTYSYLAVDSPGDTIDFFTFSPQRHA